MSQIPNTEENWQVVVPTLQATLLMDMSLPNSENYPMTNKHLGLRDSMLCTAPPTLDYHMSPLLPSQGHKTVHKLTQGNCLEKRFPSY